MAREMLSVVSGVVRAVLGVEQVDPEQPLTAAGMDSLLAVELRNALQREVGIPLSATVAYDHPTTKALGSHIASLVLAKEATQCSLAGSDTLAVAVPDTHVETKSDSVRAVAIVGASCRMPGGSDSLTAFWNMMRDGVFAVTEIPKERFDVDRVYNKEPGTPGRTYTKRAALVDGVDMFDAAFFGIPPSEASNMDPQQRLLLEVTWEAMEHAGMQPQQLSGSAPGTAVGAFIGCCNSDFAIAAKCTTSSPYGVTGTTHSALPGRLSYVFGFGGPSVAVDTACSSSLVATAFAQDSLLKGDCSAAVVGGV
jgi:acyl carrier protein